MEAHYRALKEWREGVVPTEPGPEGGVLLKERPQTLAEALDRAVAPLLQTADGTQTDDQVLIEWMYRGYVEHWRDDPEWKIAAVEHASEIWLPTDRGGRSRFKLKIKIDLVVVQDGQLWVVDHKSGKDLPKDKELDIDDQFGLYTWGLRRMGKKVFGSLHNAARTQRNVSKPQPLPERFSRTRLTRTPQELDTLAVEAYRTMKAAYQWKEGTAPRAPDSDRCRWRCNFTEPCLFSRKGNDERQFLLDTGFIQDFERH